MADDDDRRWANPPTVPERQPDAASSGAGPPRSGRPEPGTRRSGPPEPELPGSATRFVAVVMVVGVLLAFAVLVVIATTTGGSDGRSPGEAAASPSSPAPRLTETTESGAGATEPTASGTLSDRSAGADGFELDDITHVTVPDVVDLDLQSAQELLFPQLRTTSVDATGQDRRQIVDRNWVVVRTDPAAGKRVPRFTDVTLYVIKPGELPVL